MGFIPEWAIGGGFIIVVLVVVVSVAITVLRKLGIDTSPNAESGELRQALETLHKRVAELEERLDFAERLLAKHGDTDRLPSPPR